MDGDDRAEAVRFYNTGFAEAIGDMIIAIFEANFARSVCQAHAFPNQRMTYGVIITFFFV